MKSEQGLRFEPLFFRQKSIAENCSGTEHGVLCKLVISERKAPPFTAAPGARTIVCGMRPVITDAQPIGGLRKIRNSPITGRIGQVDGFNLPYLLFAAALFGCYFRFLYNKTPHGKYMYAIGGNETAAALRLCLCSKVCRSNLIGNCCRYYLSNSLTITYNVL